mmetsp:Transcript_41333/g.137442  ORF Transcript_41333/g.137442 Transcript_41333/m.137442 type:complete len:121 (+) Transcript_41333:483-845(+)
MNESSSSPTNKALLYLSTPEGARLSFPELPAEAGGPLEVQPAPGTLVSFPNDAAHVHARTGRGERIFVQFPINPGSASEPRHFGYFLFSNKSHSPCPDGCEAPNRRALLFASTTQQDCLC